MRWSDDPRLREGLTSLESVVPQSRKREESTTVEPLSQREVGKMLVTGLDIILQVGDEQTKSITKRIAQSLKDTVIMP